MAEKKRNPWSLQVKIEIFNRKEAHPDESWTVISNFFTEKWDKKINRSMAFKSFRQIKDQKEKGAEFKPAESHRSRIVSVKKMKFEQDLFDYINHGLLRSPMTFETVRILARYSTAQNEKKRKQPPITNFFVKKQTNKQ